MLKGHETEKKELMDLIAWVKDRFLLEISNNRHIEMNSMEILFSAIICSSKK